MEHNEQLYDSMLSRLYVDISKREDTLVLFNEHYCVRLERTLGFTILWQNGPGDCILAIYDWYGQNVFDLTDGVAGYQIGGEKRRVVDQFLGFAPNVIFIRREGYRNAASKNEPGGHA